ncbi:MAG: bifunctional phosphoribosylaminoimidazolecarboxamide formyltransferase/IMP cyclohydrolase [Planctomycetota bacterium]
MKVRRALFSLTDKRGAAEFARGLERAGVEVLSTGNTARVLREAGVSVIDVSEFTGFPEILDGRVKTLHPKVHAGLLSRRDDAGHQAQMREHSLEPIDLVVVNLYPFEQVVSAADVALADAIENIDIGGPSMVRSAAKNHEDVAVVVDPDDYPGLLAELKQNDFSFGIDTLRRLARKAFSRTAAYDAAISRFLCGRPEFGSGEARQPPHGLFEFKESMTLRYGENPHQAAWFHPLSAATEPSLATATQHGGKELSYNNIMDSDAALALVREFDRPACVVIKHTNPCGAAVGETPIEAYRQALAGDPLSAFGGILAFNRDVDEALADQVAQKDRFFECIIAPAYSEKAVEVLSTRQKWGKNVRLLSVGNGPEDLAEPEVRKVRGGMLIQERDRTGPADPFKSVAKKVPDAAMEASLRFAWIVVKHVKSNAIVLVKDCTLVGVGAGQMSRVDSVALAVKKAGERAKGSVLASDAFFPFRDGVDEAGKAGVVAIVQPGGSVRDKEAVEAADEHGMAMVFTGVRHFRH